MTGEWSLIGFTILSQMAVGVFLLLGVVHFAVSRQAGRSAADQMGARALLAIGPVLAAALLASLFHLGYPANALNAFSNIGSSWLSREIVCFALFAMVGGLFALLQWRELGPPALRRTVAWLAAGLGLALVYSMSRVYLLRTVPPWDTWLTPAAFMATTFLLGALALGLAFVVNHHLLLKTAAADDPRLEVQGRMLRLAVRWLAIIVLGMLGIEFIIIPLQLSHLARVDALHGLGLADSLARFQWLLGLRLAFVFCGAVVFVRLLHHAAAAPSRLDSVIRLNVVAFLLVASAEVLGRFLFYAWYARSGI
jgi:anaerobic dimethyl sulfoxide reductase subunit C (anchor subunit)